MSSLLVLGIETSCDETALALVRSDKTIVAQSIASQFDTHAVYGGVVPNLAAHDHMVNLPLLTEALFQEAGVPEKSIDAIAVTAGPGLIGGVMIGFVFAKALAFACQKPLIPINHLEGHALTPRLTNNVSFPYLLLLISGGHTQFILIYSFRRYVLLGTAIDDALGETFDKVARMLGLPYPGGPHLEEKAKKGNPKRFSWTIPLYNRAGCDFSFSGLKTAVMETIQEQKRQDQTLTDQTCCDIAASFQYTIGRVLINRLGNALKIAKGEVPALKTVVLSGGGRC